MKSKTWIIGWFTLVIITLCIIGGWVYSVDPYFHYHEPDVDTYFYHLYNQRSQNNGICKHFKYDALITGTSMTENFKASEMNEIFGVNSIKVSYSGSTYKEINDNLKVALKHNKDLKTVVRCLDMGMFFDDKDRMREDLGTYPTYLYDKNPFNDVNYLFNKDVIFGRVYQMDKERNEENFVPGITSFDDYSRWQTPFVYGAKTIYPQNIEAQKIGDPLHLTDIEKKRIEENITQNVTSLADAYPQVEFYYFFSPYSIAWWQERAGNGSIYKYIEAEQYIIELILEHENIYLYSFNNCTDITTDLNHYKDVTHYGPWVNSILLKWMHDGKCLLTKENYKAYLKEELDFYTQFDYTTINEQEDYDCDYYAAALLNEEYTGIPPVDVLNSDEIDIEVSSAEIVEDQYKETDGVRCVGRLQKMSKCDMSLAEYIYETEYIGVKIKIPNLGEHNYFSFCGKKVKDHGQPTVYVYNDRNEVVTGVTAGYYDIGDEWRRYVIDLSKIEGGATIIMNGAYVDNSGSVDSTYIFSDIKLY